MCRALTSNNGKLLSMVIPEQPITDLLRRVQNWYGDAVVVSQIREQAQDYYRRHVHELDPTLPPFACAVIDEVHDRMKAFASDDGRAIQPPTGDRELWKAAAAAARDGSLTHLFPQIEDQREMLKLNKQVLIRMAVEKACRPTASPDRIRWLHSAIETVKEMLSAIHPTESDTRLHLEVHDGQWSDWPQVPDGESVPRPVAKPDGWTKSELVAQARAMIGSFGGTTFDRIRKEAKVEPTVRGGVGQQRRFSIAELRKLIASAKARKGRRGQEIATAWSELLPH